MNRGPKRLSVEELRVGEFVVATLRVHAGWLEAEQIDVIKFGTDSPSPPAKEGIPATNATRVT